MVPLSSAGDVGQMAAADPTPRRRTAYLDPAANTQGVAAQV